MEKPNECKYCGCKEIRTETDSEIVFRCWSSYLSADGYWTVSGNCAVRCAVQLVKLRANVQRAVEVLERSQDALEILRGNSPETPDSSPITADDLAVSDYFEAVQQRVPWMVSVEHIEGLVEGFRRCGLMVWEVAEHIQRVYGGEYGQAE